MKKMWIVIAGLCLTITGCSKKTEGIKLVKDSPEYELAAKVAEKLPYFDPEANHILAQGKDIEITTGTVIKQLYLMAGKRSSQILSLPEDRLRSFMESNVESSVQEALLMQQIRKEGFHIDPAQLDSTLQAQYAQAGGEEQMKQQLAFNQIAIEDFNKDIENKMLINEYFNEKFGAESVPTEQEILDRYAMDLTATVRHILFLTQGKSDEEKAAIREKAEEVLAMAREGKNFAKLAKKYSEDPGSKDNGGLYENFKRGEMVQPFEEASFNLPIGAISDLVETRYGYHIVKVESRSKETRPLIEVRQTLSDQLELDKKKTLFESHIADLKLDSDIEYAPF
ncbi:peptidylprolyl isomerase [bacterium]|nr:peptidylprolyl isomerase [bacterium]